MRNCPGNDEEGLVTRNLIIATTFALAFVVGTGGSAAVVGAHGARASGTSLDPNGANPVQRENLRPGSASWSLDQTARPRRIEGYASEVSVLPGQKVDFHVSTSPAARYQIVLYRLGWYRGAGARIFACIPRLLQGSKGQGPTSPVRREGPGSLRPAGRSPTHSDFREAQSVVASSPSSSSPVAEREARSRISH